MAHPKHLFNSSISLLLFGDAEADDRQASLCYRYPMPQEEPGLRYDDIYFEEFEVGRKFETAARRLSEQDIIAFGKDFAPLPYHTDPEAAKDTMFGEVVAAGLHTASLAFGLFVETGVFGVCGMGSPGLDRLRWLKPVRPGDELRAVATVSEASPARDDKGRNLIRLAFETLNQHDEVVMTMQTAHYVRSRPPER